MNRSRTQQDLSLRLVFTDIILPRIWIKYYVVEKSTSQKRWITNKYERDKDRLKAFCTFTDWIKPVAKPIKIEYENNVYFSKTYYFCAFYRRCQYFSDISIDDLKKSCFWCIIYKNVSSTWCKLKKDLFQIKLWIQRKT